MLRTLKWVYNLGVRQERLRISRILENEASNNANEFEVAMGMLRDSSAKTRNKKSLELKVAVNDRVREIIGRIVMPNYDDQGVPSLMFPYDKEEK